MQNEKKSHKKVFFVLFLGIQYLLFKQKLNDIWKFLLTSAFIKQKKILYTHNKKKKKKYNTLNFIFKIPEVYENEQNFFNLNKIA